MGLDSKHEPRTSGKPQSAVRWNNVSLQAFHGALLDASHAIVTVSMTDAQAGVTSVLGHISEPAIVDLQTGALQPLSGYFLDRAKSGDRSNILAVTTGAFARVQGAGDCLNVRATASTDGTSLGCFKDGVLLRLGGTTLEAGGRKWLAVSTPLSGSGWAAAQYLSPLAGPPRDSASYPASTRTGNADIDPVLAAVESGNGQQIFAITGFSQAACTDHPEGIGAPPKCPQGVSEGTPIEVIPVSACEGALVPRTDFEASPAVPGVGMPLDTIVRADSSQAWQYTVMFTNPTNGLAAALYVTKGKITGTWSGCSETPAEWLASQPHGEFILPPKTP
jgi:hypothetical protein